MQTLEQLRSIQGFGELLTRAQNCLEQRRLAQSERLFRRAVVAATTAFGASHIKVAEALWQLANVLRIRATGKHSLCKNREQMLAEALKLGEQYLSIRTALLGDNLGEISSLHDDLAYFTRDCGDYRRAIYHKRKSLRLASQTGEPISEGFVHSLGHLGLFYYYGLNDEREAERIFKRCLKLCAKAHGGSKDTWDCWYLYDELAKIYKARSERLQKLDPNRPPS